MGLIDRIESSRAEKRVIGGVPWQPWLNPYFQFGVGGPAHPSKYAFGAEAALSLVPLYAGSKLLAEGAASLPIDIYLDQGMGKSRRWYGPSFFDKPTVDGTIFDWIMTCVVSMVLWGNAWGFITGRDSYGFPTGIDWINPEDVIVEQDRYQPFNTQRSRVYFYGREVKRGEYFHVKTFPIPGKIEGVSLVRAFAQTIENGVESQRYGTDWYRSGGFPPGVMQNTELKVDKKAADEMKGKLIRALRRREPLVYGRDWDYKPITVPPSEAQFIAAMQMNATQIAALLNVPPDRISGVRSDSLTYNCVDAETEILTQRGWLRNDQVTTEDVALTLNTESGMAEWQPVQSVHVFEEGPFPVTKWESQGHSSVSTPNHRWPVMIKGRKGSASNGSYRWSTTESAPTDSGIASAAPVVAPVEAKWSDALTELIAWFWTEGWHNQYGSVTITQSETVNPQNVSRIRQALTEVFGPSGALQVRSEPSWREDHSFQANGKKIVHFRLNAKAGRQLLEHAPDKVVSTEFLSQLTRAQLELFYQVSIDADGTRRPGGKGDVIAQKDKARLDAFQVACALTGRAGVVCGPNSRGMYHMSVKVTPWVKPKGHKEYVSDEVTDLVWCVQTPNKSWFARRNGTCYFTGNTTEQSSLQLIDALRPWLCRLELAFFDLLPARRVVRFNTDALLKTDLEARTNIYQTQRNIGLRTIDELRELEGLEPLPQGIGQEAMPLVLMNAMATRAGGIPKTLLPSIALEMDLAADRLENLEKIGLGTPDAPPPLTQDAATFLAGLVNINRSYKHNEAGQAAGQLLQNIENRLRQLEEDRAHPVQVPELHVHNERPESVPDAQQKQDNWRQYVDGAMKDLLAKKDAPQIPEVHVHLHDRAFPDTPGTGNNPAVAPPAVPVNKPALDKDATEDTDIDNTPGLSHDSGMISLDVPHGTLPHPDGGVGHHHVTLAYLGDHVSDDELAAAKGKAHEVASTLATRPEADIGGPTSSFHGTKNNPGKRVDYAPVTNPSEGMHELHDRLSPLNKSDYADQDWTPHVTLKYSDPSDSPVEDTPVKHVKFTHITVKRGDETTQYPFADDLSDEG